MLYLNILLPYGADIENIIVVHTQGSFEYRLFYNLDLRINRMFYRLIKKDGNCIKASGALFHFPFLLANQLTKFDFFYLLMFTEFQENKHVMHLVVLVKCL